MNPEHTMWLNHIFTMLISARRSSQLQGSQCQQVLPCASSTRKKLSTKLDEFWRSRVLRGHCIKKVQAGITKGPSIWIWSPFIYYLFFMPLSFFFCFPFLPFLCQLTIFDVCWYCKIDKNSAIFFACSMLNSLIRI